VGQPHFSQIKGKTMKTLTPAYGRDYKSAEAVLKDYTEGKDFVVQPQAQYCSIRDFPDEIVKIRYSRLTKAVLTD
jgi:hypothetical protein